MHRAARLPAALVSVGSFLLVVVLTLLGLLAVTFFIGRVIPIDPVLAIVGDRAPEHVVDRVHEELGLNKPLVEQFAIYVSKAVRGDFGTSVLTSNPVWDDIRKTFPATLELATCGILIGVGLTNASQALLAIIVYLSLGVPRAVVLGLLTGIAGFVPITGTALIWAPVAAGLYFTDHPAKAIVMVAFGVVISTMDNVLRPIFARYGKLDLPVYLLFLSVFGGLAVWGVFGAVLGPLVLRMAIEALALVREDRESELKSGPPR